MKRSRSSEKTGSPAYPRLSVVIPTLNEEANIGVLLDALLRGHEVPDEIIVSDGGSEDGTAEVVKSKAAAGSRVRLVQTERGTAHQRNAGAAVATGDLLLFMDADNKPDERFCGRVAAAYRRWPFAVACPWFVARDSAAIYACYCWFNLLFFLGQSWLRTGSGVCLITPRRVWEQTGGFREDLHLGEDVEFLRRCARHGWHRHLLIPLETSGRRFSRDGVWKLMCFYGAISPLILLGRWEKLRQINYEATPSDGSGTCSAPAEHPPR